VYLEGGRRNTRSDAVISVQIKSVPAECAICGEQTACTIVAGDLFSVVSATLVALLAAGWKFVTYEKEDDDPRLVCGACYAAMGGLPGGRGA
jgi:hypothetical protein